MAIFAANRGFQIALEIQSRGLLISSLAKKGYNTSDPVRYIPKNYNRIKEPQKAPALEISEKKEGTLFKNRASVDKRGAGKLREFDDKEHQNSVSHSENSKSNDIPEQIEELPELEVGNRSDLELMDEDVECMSEMILDKDLNSIEEKIAKREDLLSASVRQDVEKLAIQLLAARAFTELELRKKLRRKKYPPNIVESVITDIKSGGLLNDGLYAESFSRSRWLSSTWGPRRIKQALVHKGVKGVEAEKAITQVFEGDDADGEGQITQHGMSKVSMDRLFLQASKQWLQSQSTAPEKRKARIVRWLQYRGFSWRVTNFIWKKLEAQYPP